jgi:hypothetical protein
MPSVDGPSLVWVSFCAEDGEADTSTCSGLGACVSAAQLTMLSARNTRIGTPRSGAHLPVLPALGACKCCTRVDSKNCLRELSSIGPSLDLLGRWSDPKCTPPGDTNRPSTPTHCPPYAADPSDPVMYLPLRVRYPRGSHRNALTLSTNEPRHAHLHPTGTDLHRHRMQHAPTAPP